MSCPDSFHLETFNPTTPLMTANLSESAFHFPSTWYSTNETELVLASSMIYEVLGHYHQDIRFYHLFGLKEARGVFACYLKDSKGWFVIYGKANEQGHIMDGHRMHIPLSVRQDKANLFLRSKMIADYILYIDS